MNAGRGLLAAADDAGQQLRHLRMEQMHKVSAVVDDDVRSHGERGSQVLLILLRRAAVVGVHMEPVTYISAPPMASTRQR